MKLGVLTNLMGAKSLEETLSVLKPLGVQMVELGCGGYPGKDHCNPELLLSDEKALQNFKNVLAKYEMPISALSCHGNPIHPNKDLAAMYDKDIRNGILMAEKLGVHQINTFSGCPGDSEGSQYPNWVTCSWPEDYLAIKKWQWEEKLIPYWTDLVKFAKEHGVDKIAFELHPGFCVYNTSTMLEIREAVGPELGANLDPSHLWWQGMDPVMVIRKLGEAGAIFHFHAKDTRVDKYNTAVNGVLDTGHYGNVSDRSWVFRTVGYGHDADVWKDMVSMLRKVGYDYVMSIEHEDSLMGISEGLTKAVRFLQDVMVFEGTDGMWWA